MYYVQFCFECSNILIAVEYNIGAVQRRAPPKWSYAVSSLEGSLISILNSLNA